jgi:hypothetical protein
VVRRRAARSDGRAKKTASSPRCSSAAGSSFSDDLGLFGGCRWSHDGVRSDSGEADGLGVYRFARTVAYELVNVYAMRIAGVFMISTYTLAIRVGMFPRWTALLGYALVLLLLLSPGRFNWAPLVFPLSAFVISVYVLLANLRPKAA